MFAKEAKKKRNPSISESSFDAVEYRDNIYTLHTNDNNNRSSAQNNTAFDEQIYVDHPPENDKRFKKKTIAAILYLAFSVNVLIILLLVPNRFTSDLSSIIPVELSSILQNIPNYSSKEVVEQPLEIQLKNMALSVMQFGDWNTQKIERIDMSWQSFSAGQQNKIKQEVWFQLFENAIIHELNTFKNNANTPTKMPAEAFALTTMAKTLGIREIPEYKLAKVEKNLKTAAKNIHATTATKINKATPVSIKKTNSTNLVKAQPHKKNHKQNHKNNKPPIQKKKLKPQTKTVTVKQSDNPTLSELSDITVQFEDSYEEGNLEKLMSLFSMKAISNRFDNVNEIEQQYSDLFRSTSERQIFIHDMKWTYSKGKAVGKGKMETLLMTDTDSKVRSSNSRVQLVVEKLGETTRITRFYELER